MADTTVPTNKRKAIWNYIGDYYKRQWVIGKWEHAGSYIGYVMTLPLPCCEKYSPFGESYVWKYYQGYNYTWPQTTNEVVVKCTKF